MKRSVSGAMGIANRWQTDSKQDSKQDSKTIAVKERKGKERKENTTTPAEPPAGGDGSDLVNWDNCKTDLQRFLAYYISVETPELYKRATKAQANAVFKRYGRAASEFLGVAGGLGIAKRAFDLAAAHFAKKGLSWNLSTVTANSAEFVNAALMEANNGNNRK